MCSEILGVECKLNVAQRYDDASRGFWHRRIAKKLPGRVVGRVGFFRLAKHMGSEGEEDRSQRNDTFREHYGLSLGSNLRENNTVFNSKQAPGKVLTGEI